MNSLTREDLKEIGSAVDRYRRGSKATAICGVLAIAFGSILFVWLDLLSGVKTNAALMIVVGISMLSSRRTDRLLAVLAIEVGITGTSTPQAPHTLGQIAAIIAVSGLAIYCVWLWNIT